MTLSKDRFEAAFAKSSAGLPTAPEQDPAVQELWALLEPTLEDRKVLEHEARDHLQENTRDIRSWRRARFFSAAFAVAVVLVTMITLAFMLSANARATHISDLGSDNVRIAFLAGSFAIIFGLTALLVRGAYGGQKKDESSAMMPENARVVLETFGELFKARG